MTINPNTWLIRGAVALVAAVPSAVWAGFQAASAPAAASSPVPEPGTLILVGVGVIAAMTVARNKRK